MTPIIGINYFFGEAEKNDGFMREGVTGSAGFAKGFKKRLEAKYDVEIHSWDCVDWNSNRVKYVLYLDCGWRSLLKDPYLKRIPKEKRALFLIEPMNVNPALYFVPFVRNLFTTVFTWDEQLLQRNPAYIPVNVLLGAEPSKYRENPFGKIPFAEKRLLFSASNNRWSYMPQSAYRERKRAYAWFDKYQPEQFDLFGQNWNAPAVWYEKLLGYPRYKCWRGVLPGGFSGKVEKMTHYKFAICFENNACQPGYISEKITDCFCSRCVPVYLGTPGVEKRIPHECFIDMHDFKSYAELERYLVGMSESEHAAYLTAIESFLHSPAIEFFSSAFYFGQIANGLGLKRRCANNMKRDSH